MHVHITVTTCLVLKIIFLTRANAEDLFCFRDLSEHSSAVTLTDKQTVHCILCSSKRASSLIQRAVQVTKILFTK